MGNQDAAWIKVSLGGGITLVRVGGQGGMIVDVLGEKWTEPSAGKTGGPVHAGKQTKHKKHKKVRGGEDPLWAPTPPLFLFRFLKKWSVSRTESSNNRTSSAMAVVLWSSGSKKDGLVHFYCLANAPNSLRLLINHSQYAPIPQ